MVRLKTKYDHAHYKRAFPKSFRLDKNFNIPIEELAKRNPRFRESWLKISSQAKKRINQASTKEERQRITKQANKQIWEHMIKAIKN